MLHHIITLKVTLALGLWIIVSTLLIGSMACSSGGTSNTSTSAPVASSTASAPNAAGVTKETKNPLTEQVAAAAAGKMRYAETCAGCHGDTGHGDGPAAAAFDPKPADLTKSEVMSATDGTLFLVVKQGKMRNGKVTMEPVKILTDEQIWQIIAYVRTLAK